MVIEYDNRESNFGDEDLWLGKSEIAHIIYGHQEALQQVSTDRAGFKSKRSCADQIASLRIIIEQSLEWKSPLYVNFIDYEEAFDSVDRETLWKILRHYGVPENLADAISLPPCYRLDSENCHSRQEEWNTVDTPDTTWRPRLCLWPGSPLTQPQSDAGQDNSPGNYLSKNWTKDQPEENRIDEDKHHCLDTSYSWWYVHYRSRVLYLPWECGGQTGWHRLWHQVKNWEGKDWIFLA